MSSRMTAASSSQERTTAAEASKVTTPEESAKAAYPSPAQRWISDAISVAAALILAALTLMPVRSSAFYDSSERPQSAFLQGFDVAFRRVGALMPALPWLIRAVGHNSLPVRLQELPGIGHPMPELLLLLASQAVRFGLHIVHVAGQKTHCWYVRDGTCGQHPRHLFADHVLLGVAVQAFAAVELAAAMHTAHRLLVQRKFPRSDVPSRALATFAAAAFCAAALLALTTFETINTALFFHPQREIVTALWLGAPLFIAPAIGYLYAWSNLQDAT